MEKLRNGIYATAMDLHIKNMYEELDNEDDAECLMNSWLALGVPDGNELTDNIIDFGEQEDFNELFTEYKGICEFYNICQGFSKEVEEIKKNIVEMLDNPYYNMV